MLLLLQYFQFGNVLKICPQKPEQVLLATKTVKVDAASSTKEKEDLMEYVTQKFKIESPPPTAPPLYKSR